MLIEDNSDYIKLVRDALAKVRGSLYKLMCVGRLSTGLECLTKNKVDVVLLDLSLSDSQGLDTLIEIRAQTPGVPVLVISANDDETISAKALHAGAEDFLIIGELNGALLGRSIRFVMERKQMLGELDSAQERLAATIQSINDGFITTDADGMVVLLNKEAENLTGWFQHEACGKPLADIFMIVNKKNKNRCENPVEKILQTGGIVGLASHTVLIAKDGTERTVADHGVPIQGQDGKLVGVVLLFHDVTETWKMEDNIQKAQRLESISVLAGGIAHDFNNILTAVLGNVSLAKTFLESQDNIHDLLTEVEKATLRASDLTQQLLSFSKGGAPIAKSISVAELLKDIISFALRGSKVKCDCSIAEDCWPVEIDEGQISQIINNLIINADQAMPEGGTIKIDCENIIIETEDILPLEKGRHVKITIKDEGPGIPEEHLHKIFDPYFTTKQEGTGLGLASTYSIVRRHNGHVSVESEMGVGTIFHIYFPASCKETQEIDYMEILKQDEIKEKPIPSNGKILLLEDEEIVRDVVVNLLNRIGYSVTTVTDGYEAIERYKSAKEAGEPFEVLIMDLTIPGGMGGKEAIKKLLETDLGVKAIASSGYSDESIMPDFRKYGFSGFVAKPYKIQQLSRIVRELITGIRE